MPTSPQQKKSPNSLAYGHRFLQKEFYSEHIYDRDLLEFDTDHVYS